MAPDPIVEPVVQYGMKELLANLQTSIDTGFATVATRLEGKADKADVESLRSDLRHVVERTEGLEAWRREQDATHAAERDHEGRGHEARTWRLALVGAAIYLAGLGWSIASGLIHP